MHEERSVNQAILEFYTAHSPFSDPGEYADLLEALPDDIPGLCQAVRGLVVHYRAEGIRFPPEREAEIDTRWAKAILAKIASRDPAPLTVARAKEERFVGCCRDFSLLFVAALRQKGVPARSRVGFATYFLPDFNPDHVVSEYWNGERWVRVDPELEPGFPFNPHDMPPGQFLSASEVWRWFRRGELEHPERFGVAPNLPYRGDWFIRNYVIHELAHLNKQELLLWDWWGAMSSDLTGDLKLIDQAADRIVQGDAAWEGIRELFRHPLLGVPSQVRCYSPTGLAAEVRLSRSELP